MNEYDIQVGKAYLVGSRVVIFRYDNEYCNCVVLLYMGEFRIYSNTGSVISPTYEQLKTRKLL